MATPLTDPICRRIAELRAQRYGERGKALFAKALGISASTYNYYEALRVPPAELLVKIADLTQVDLRWLLTGMSQDAPVPDGHPAIDRIVAFLHAHPDKIEPLTAFVELLSASLSWPAKPQAAKDDESAPPEPAATSAAPASGGWIPVLGRSAAGVPRFWKKPSDAKGVSLLSELAKRSSTHSLELQPMLPGLSDAPAQAVQVVHLSEPLENVSEFVSASALKTRYPDAFAVRIDGDSMSPEIRHGDLIVCSPSCAAEEGKCALVQLANQIGVTCKLFRREGAQVHLVPINEQYPPQKFPADQLLWAVKVLALLKAKV